jgi:hypothetical protein
MGIKAGQRIWIGGFSGFASAAANGEFATVVSVSGNNLTLASNLVQTYGDSTPVYVSLTSDSQMPDDIVLDRVLMDHPTQGQNIRRFIDHEGRRLTIVDSYMDGPRYPGADTQIVGGINAVGPVVITNTALIGASENLMYGGDFPALDREVDSGIFRYNYSGRFMERDRTGAYCLLDPVQNYASGACVNEQGRDFSVNVIDGNTRLVFTGRQVYASSEFFPTLNPALGYMQAMNTGWTGTTEPDWGSVGVGSTICDAPASVPAGVRCDGDPTHGVLWKRIGGSWDYRAKNNFELKMGKNWDIAFNHFSGFPDQYWWNQFQSSIINIKSTAQPPDGLNYCSGGCSSPFPLCSAGDAWGKVVNGQAQPCYRARTYNITLRHNLIDAFSGGLTLMGSQGSYPHPTDLGNFDIHDNLWLQNERQWDTAASRYTNINLAPSWDLSGYNNGVIPGWIKIRNEAFISPFQMPRSAMYSDNNNTPGLNFPNAANEFSGNIQATGGWGNSWQTNAGVNGGTDGTGSVAIFPGSNSRWIKNVFLGVPTGAASYPVGSTISNCGNTTAACAVDWKWSGPQVDGNTYGKLFRDFDRGDYRINPSNSWAKGSTPSRSDVGPDVTKLPLINDVRVTASDTAVLLQWRVTASNQQIPGIVEVSTRPDFGGGYVGELSNITTYHGYDADDHDRHPRYAYERTVVVGKSVPLTPGTRYYWRIWAGGMMRRGYVDTKATLSGTGSLSGSGITQWGTTYSRTSDTISGGATGSGTFTGVTKGIVYFRQNGVARCRVVL